MRIAGSSGRLIVADVTQGGQVTSSVAAAVSLGTGGDGYLVAAIFPSGGWDAERADFLRVFASFRAGVPPGFDVPRDRRERLIASRPFGPWGNGSPADSGSASPSSNLGGPATTATRAGPGRQQTPTSFVSVLLLSLDSVTSSFASASAVTVPPMH